jgi:hypothetical protein
MPLTPNGKIDKIKLPFPDAAIMAQQIKYDGRRASMFVREKTALHGACICIIVPGHGDGF